MDKAPDKQVDEKGRMSPGFLVLSSWIILLLLIVLFGYDVNMWAFSSDSRFVQETVQPQAQKLSKFSVDMKLRQLRQDVEGKVHPIYDDSPIYAEIEEADED